MSAIFQRFFIRLFAVSMFPGSFLEAADSSSGKTPQPATSNDVPAGIARPDWQGIREAYEAGRHAVVAVEDGHEARNPGQQWCTEFDGRGFTAQPDAGGWHWGLELKSFGFAGNEQAVTGKPAVLAQGTRLTYAWGTALEEWFVNDRRGLEHGFTVNARPSKDGQDSKDGKDAAAASAFESLLSFTLAVRGNLRPAVSAEAVQFQDEAGATVLTYTGLKVWDADGKTLPSHFAAVEAGVRIVVDERGARYPITVDPIAQQAYLKAPDQTHIGFIGDSFGDSVAVSGDTVVVGSGAEDGSGTGVNPPSDALLNHAGAAYVFVRSGVNWSQQAYLKASNSGSDDYFGTHVAIAGETVVVGADYEDGSGIGANPPSDELATDAGAAYVFMRNGVIWRQQAYLKASNTGVDDEFGAVVAVSGETVIVGSRAEDGSGTGVNPVSDELIVNAGAAYVFAGFVLTDFGDAPVSYGPVSHTFSGDPGFVLGSSVDEESTQPFSVDALGDDSAGADDENGVTATVGGGIIPWQRGAWTQLRVEVQLPSGVTEAKLDAWIDWDFTGTFIPALEQALNDYPVVEGINLIPLQVPLTAVPGLTFARYRLTRDGVASQNGAAFSGEVEDYRITIVDPSPATGVQAYQRDGQVWVTWDYAPASAPQVYEVYRSTNAGWNNVSQGTLVAQLFQADYSAGQLTKELALAFGGAGNVNFTIPHPNVANPPVTLAGTKGLCVSTVRANGNFSWAVVPRGATAIAAGNKTPLVAQVFNAASPPKPHLQQNGAVSGYPVTFYSLWADGGNAGDAPRPDFPFMANRNRNAHASLFFVMEPPGGVPPGPVPAAVALHSGDDSAAMWLPGQQGFASVGLAPVDGFVICMEDKLVSLVNAIGDPSNTSWLGYVAEFDALANVRAFFGAPEQPNPLPPNGAPVRTYTLDRLDWTLDWLLANRPIDPSRVSVFGHSGGAKGALLWSHARPARFASACLYGPGLGDFTRNVVLRARHGSPDQNLNTTLTNRSGGAVPLRDTVYLTRSLSPQRDTPPTRIYIGQLEENWAVDANADFLGDVIADAKAADSAGNGTAFHWDQRHHGVNEWTLAAVSALDPACTFTPADFWVPDFAGRARRDDAAYQSRYRSNQSYPAFSNLLTYANHGDIGTINYGGVPFVPNAPWTGPADPCRPKFPAHTGDRRGTWGGWFDWINNGTTSSITDTPTQWGCTIFLAGSTGPDGQAHSPTEASPHATLMTDVAIRRPQQFLPAPATSLTWLSMDETTRAVQQSGTAGFDPDSVVRVNGVNVPRDPARLRLMVAAVLDFGDAPSCYPVTTTQNGARHIEMPGFRLGAAITQENDGIASPAAGADGPSDDGVMLPPAFTAGFSGNIGINASAPGKVDAWIDWNADGDWTDSGEQILTSHSVVAGAQIAGMFAPADAAEGQTYARFRLSKSGGLTPAGAAADGEVEDYLVHVIASPVGDPAPVESTNPADLLRYTTNLAGDPVFQWLGRPGEMATLEMSTDLVLWRPWFPVGAPAVTGPVEFPVPVLAGPRAYFRLIRTPLGTNSAIPCVPGLHLRMAFTHAGLGRTYSLYIPPQHPVSACPLALILHGGGQSGPSFIGQRNGELSAAADTRAMILCFPDATAHDASGTSWFKHDEVPGQPYLDDQAFLDALVTHLLAVLNVDTHRLYAAGFSSGGQMTHYLGGRSTTNFAAFAACATSAGSNVVGLPGITIAPVPSAPKAMLIINLRDDTSFPFFGSPDKLPAIDSVNHWALANGCPPPPAPTNTTTVGAIPHRITTGNYLCPLAPVRFVSIESGGHIWPDAADAVGYNANLAVLDWMMTFATP